MWAKPSPCPSGQDFGAARIAANGRGPGLLDRHQEAVAESGGIRRKPPENMEIQQ